MNDFDFEGFLGAGAFGQVVLAKCTRADCPISGEQVAIKILPKCKIVDSKNVIQVRHERDLLAQIDHNFVLKVQKKGGGGETNIIVAHVPTFFFFRADHYLQHDSVHLMSPVVRIYLVRFRARKMLRLDLVLLQQQV